MTLNVTIKNTSTNGLKAKVKFFDKNNTGGPDIESELSKFTLDNGEERDVTLWDTRYLTVTEVLEKEEPANTDTTEAKGQEQAA